MMIKNISKVNHEFTIPLLFFVPIVPIKSVERFGIESFFALEDENEWTNTFSILHIS